MDAAPIARMKKVAAKHGIRDLIDDQGSDLRTGRRVRIWLRTNDSKKKRNGMEGIFMGFKSLGGYGVALLDDDTVQLHNPLSLEKVTE